MPASRAARGNGTPFSRWGRSTANRAIACSRWSAASCAKARLCISGNSWGGIGVPFEVHFKSVDTLLLKKCPFAGCIFTRVQLGQSAALYCRVSTADQTCARQERDLRAFAKKAGYKIVGIYKETASGAKNDRAERKKILDLVQARKIDVVLVTELTRWGRSMIDLFQTLQDLQAAGVSLVAQTGLQFDLRTAQGKLIASLMSALSEFEHDLLRERVRSGIAAARRRGVVFGRQVGQRVKADRHAPRVLKLVEAGQSYREISHRLGISKNTVLGIVKRDRADSRRAA
jgi:putative DNA-invertase from lambdoid prophage Rac